MESGDSSTSHRDLGAKTVPCHFILLLTQSPWLTGAGHHRPLSSWKPIPSTLSFLGPSAHFRAKRKEIRDTEFKTKGYQLHGILEKAKLRTQ